jgi:hypothetical protein
MKSPFGTWIWRIGNPVIVQLIGKDEGHEKRTNEDTELSRLDLQR